VCVCACLLVFLFQIWLLHFLVRFGRTVAKWKATGDLGYKNDLFLKLVWFFKNFFKRFHLLWGRGKGKEREKISSWLPAEHGTLRRAQSHHPEIIIWAKIKSWMFNRLSYPWNLYMLKVTFLMCCSMNYDKLHQHSQGSE